MESASDETRLKPLSLRTNFVWTFAGNAVSAICQSVILLVLLNEASLVEAGQYSTALAWCSPLFMFAGLDIRVLLATDSRREFRFSEYLTVRLMLASVALIVAPCISLVMGRGFESLLVFTGVATCRLLELIADAFYGLMQRAERMDRVSRSLVAHGLLSSSVLVGTVLAEGGLVAGLFLSAVVRLGLILLFDLPMARRLSGNSTEDVRASLRRLTVSSRVRLIRLMRQGGPLAVRKLLVSLNANVTRLFVDGMCGAAMAGIFAPFASGVTAATTVSRALNQAVASRLGKLAGEGRMREFRRLILNLQLLYLAMGICGVAGVWLFGELVLSFLVPPEVVEFSGVLLLVVVAVAVQYQGGILDMGLVALRRVKVLVPVSASTLAVTAIGCWVLIPVWSLYGAGIAMIAGRIVRVTILNVLIIRETRLCSAGRTAPEEVEPTPDGDVRARPAA